MLIHSIGKNLPQDSGAVENHYAAQPSNPEAKLTRSRIRAQFQRSLPKEDISDQALHEHAIAFVRILIKKNISNCFMEVV